MQELGVMGLACGSAIERRWEWEHGVLYICKDLHTLGR